MLRKHRANPFSVELIAIAFFLVSLVFLLISPSPSSAYLPALYTINADGSNQIVLLKDSTRGYGGAAWSPDGKKIAFISYMVDRNTRYLYVADADGKNQRQLTGGKNYNSYPVWSPDGKFISFVTRNFISVKPAELHTIEIATNAEKRLTRDNNGSEGPVSWSMDGKQIAYHARTDNGLQIFIANIDGTNAHSVANGFSPSWSPDGRSIAFVSNRDGNYDIFVMNSDGGNQHTLTNNSDTNTSPVWSPDGQQIAFISGPQEGPWHIFVMNNEGDEIKDVAPNSDIDVFTLSWSPDSKRIIFNAVQSSTAKERYGDLLAKLRIKVIISTVLLALVLFFMNGRIRANALPLPKSNNVNDALENLEIIQNPLLKWIFRIFPWILMLVTLIGITPAFNLYPPVLRYFLRQDLFYYSGIATAAISLLIFQILLQRIPESFRTLWNRNVIAAKASSPEEKTPSGNAPVEVDEQYREFIDHLSLLLNDSRQVIVAVICGILGASWVFNNIDPGDLASAATQLIRPFFIVQFLIGFGIGYVVGLQVWRMIVIGYEIRQLGRKFDLALQLGHPDGCEGLAPLGNLCLWNALIVCPAGVDLGGWLIFGNTSYEGLLYFLLLVVVAIASASFFVPLWNVHKIMTAKREAVRQQLDQLGENMNGLARELLERANELDSTESEKIAKKLERMKQTYKDNQQISTWPFNTRTLAKFITSQIVPLLSLTGLGQPIKEVIFRLVDFFK